MTHDEFTHMVNIEAISTKFTIGARVLLFRRHPELKDKVYTRRYIVTRISVWIGRIAGILSVFVAPLYIGLAIIACSHYVSIRLVRYVDIVLLEMALADPSYYEYIVHRQYLIITVVPEALEQLSAG